MSDNKLDFIPLAMRPMMRIAMKGLPEKLAAEDTEIFIVIKKGGKETRYTLEDIING